MPVSATATKSLSRKSLQFEKLIECAWCGHLVWPPLVLCVNRLPNFDRFRDTFFPRKTAFHVQGIFASLSRNSIETQLTVAKVQICSQKKIWTKSVVKCLHKNWFLRLKWKGQKNMIVNASIFIFQMLYGFLLALTWDAIKIVKSPGFKRKVLSNDFWDLEVNDTRLGKRFTLQLSLPCNKRKCLCVQHDFQFFSILMIALSLDFLVS